MCADKKISINIDTHSQREERKSKSKQHINFIGIHTIHIEILIIPNPPRKKITRTKQEKREEEGKSGQDELLLLFYFIMFSSSREYLWNC